MYTSKGISAEVGLKLHLAKQKKQKLEETRKEKENVCVEEARRESIKENEKKAVDMSQEER